MLHGTLMSALRQVAPEYNVLFIPVDDLRPQLGCYGKSMMHTPGIDRLAAEGTVFTRAYCQQAVCSPSRTSLLTGCRPDTTQVFDLHTHFRDNIPDVITLPQQFKLHGYRTEGMGKVYHGGLDDEASWSIPHMWPKGTKGYGNPESIELQLRLRQEAIAAGMERAKAFRKFRGPAWEVARCEDNKLVDGALSDLAIEHLKALRNERFFLACGFIKPHLPFVAPKKYWDLYDHDAIELADNPFAPQDAPEYALSKWGELRAYYDMPKQGPVTEEQARWLVHGYYAATSFVDAQVNRLLDTLDELELRERTIVILWGDHGWQLGDHGMWCKHTNFETSVHAPIIISVPGQTPAHCDALVEFVDIYPTLCELCGLPLPDTLEGVSFAPLIEDPAREWKTAAFSQYPRWIPNVGHCMGYSMRTDRYRFTRWAVPEKDFVEYELYDHEVDPRENVNIAKRPENAELVAQLVAQMDAGWRGALPPGHTGA
ncbi:MAG: sulfatase [Armatimonadetes bacterium]|nr:sulfatase [Armatimonadota bacterium]